MNASMPVSKATNAYELLDEIKALALEEPLRVSMNYWRLNASDIEQDTFITHLILPACGTIGCIGGWAEALAGTGQQAADILGLTDDQWNDLFYPLELVWEADEIGQTPEHARHVIAHIAAFQQKHEAQLKDKPVTR